MIQAVELGATLYVPANRPDLAEIVSGRHPRLKSAVFCLEDSIQNGEVPLALANLARLLARTGPGRAQAGAPAIFVRPRGEAMLAHILTMPGVESLAGFVIPKATADNLPVYMECLAHDHHVLMPTLETREMLDGSEVRRLRDQLLSVQSRILAVRIGGNDLLHTIGARRSAVRTAYEGPLGGMIVALVGAFAPYGFALSAPVFEHFGNPDVLREEVRRDLEHGLLTKTAIHPCQIDVIQAEYAVDAQTLDEARSILRGEARAVFANRGSMCEPETHKRWARSVVARFDAFGLAGPSAVSSASA